MNEPDSPSPWTGCRMCNITRDYCVRCQSPSTRPKHRENSAHHRPLKIATNASNCQETHRHLQRTKGIRRPRETYITQSREQIMGGGEGPSSIALGPWSTTAGRSMDPEKATRLNKLTTHTQGKSNRTVGDRSALLRQLSTPLADKIQVPTFQSISSKGPCNGRVSVNENSPQLFGGLKYDTAIGRCSVDVATPLHTRSKLEVTPLKYKFSIGTKNFIFVNRLPDWSGPSGIQLFRDFGTRSNFALGDRYSCARLSKTAISTITYYRFCIKIILAYTKLVPCH